MRLIGPFGSITLDDSPRLLEESYRLRYQVYCLERQFLDAEGYPDERELDEFDRDSVHVGVLDAGGILAATARLVKPTSAGWPLLGHCALSAHQATLGAAGNLVVELSRVCISRRHSRRRHDVFFDGPELVGSDPPPIPMHDRRDHRDDLFTSLVKAMYQATKRIGATHWIIAVENSLRRRIARYGLPFQVAGPEVDYWGLVTPHIMSVADLDQVIPTSAHKKVDALARRLLSINPAASIRAVNDWVAPHNATGFVGEADIVFDTIDFLGLEGIVALHDAGQAQQKPIIAPLSVGWGAAAIYFPPDGTCTFRSIFGLPATGSVGHISYVGQFMRLIDRLEPDLSEDVVAALKRTLTRLDDGHPCPAPHVSVGSWAVGSLAAAIAVRVLRAQPITPAPRMIFLNLSSLCTTQGVNLV